MDDSCVEVITYYKRGGSLQHFADAFVEDLVVVVALGDDELLVDAVLPHQGVDLGLVHHHEGVEDQQFVLQHGTPLFFQQTRHPLQVDEQVDHVDLLVLLGQFFQFVPRVNDRPYWNAS